MPLPITPVQLASYVRQQLLTRKRGALLVEDTADGGFVLGVFSNDRYLFDKRVNREVVLVRRWLTAAGARDLGFGVSPDGHSWAMLLAIDDRRYRPPAGRAFYAEMVCAEVEVELDRAWRAACGGTVAPTGGSQGGTSRRAG